MKFKNLVEIFEKLEKTRSRIEMTEILANFFKSIEDPLDLKYVVTLLQGELDEKLGIAEKSLIEVIALTTSFTRQEIREVIIKHGDVGTAAEELLKKKKQSVLFPTNKSVDLDYLLAQLKKVNDYTRPIDKQKAVRSIMTPLTPLEVKYLFRVITGILRLGASTNTIIEALALTIDDEKSKKLLIEKAYNLSPDLGELARRLKVDGVSSILDVEIIYDTPIKPMLASRLDYDKILDKMGGRCFGEYKLDGERVQIHKMKDNIILYSRPLNDITAQYPDIVEIIKNEVAAKNCVLDGEIVAELPNGKMLPFQTLMKRKRKHGIEEAMREVPAVVYIFDVLKLAAKDYTNMAYMLRKDILLSVFKPSGKLKLVHNQEIKNRVELLTFFNKAKELGMEGIICKSRTGEYKAGKRTFDWVKLKSIEGGKMPDTLDVVIIGADYGRGRRAKLNIAGTFLCAVYDKPKDQFVAFTRVGTGFSDDIMTEITNIVFDDILEQQPFNVITEEAPEIWLTPKIVIELIGDEITRPQNRVYSVRFPVFQRVRKDKGPKDSTTLQEIIKIYESQ